MILGFIVAHQGWAPPIVFALAFGESLAFVSLLVCAAIGIPAGMLAAGRRGTSTDHVVGVFTLFGLSVPNFALGPVLILVFSVILGWLPVSGRGGLAQCVERVAQQLAVRRRRPRRGR